MSHEYEVLMEVEVPATPEQVWDAIATGPGIDGWFMGRTVVEPAEGGAVRTDMGDFTMESTVTAWEPGKRFGYRTLPDPDGSFMALEWLIEGRDGGSTVLRSVGSGFIGADDWEGEYDGLRKGGAYYFHTLAQYVTHFADRPVTAVSVALPGPADRAEMWAAVHRGLGLPGAPAVGDRVRLTPAGPAPIDGVVDYATEDFLGVRSGDALYRFFPRMAGALAVEHHLFAAGVDQGAQERVWQTWLAGIAG
jgi:uncharacterized protein YndB with AHSA1/START domain